MSMPAGCTDTACLHVAGVRGEMRQVQRDPDAVVFHSFVQTRATVYWTRANGRLHRWRSNDVATSVPAVPVHPSSVASVTGTVATYRSEHVAE